MCKAKLILSALTLCVLALPCPATAGEWSHDETPEYDGTDPYERVIKFCEDGGDKVRFATVALQPKGYSACGKLQSVATCDATGNRIIGKTQDRPYDHKDCATGPRIIIDHGATQLKDALADTEYEDNSEEGPVTPLSSKEKFDLNREMRGLERNQQGDPGIQIQKYADSMLKSFLSSPSQQEQARENLQNNKQAKELVSDLLKLVDPSTRSSLENALQLNR